MKFGQQFKYYKIPEYNDNYLDYDLLKTILKNIIDQHRERIKTNLVYLYITLNFLVL